MLETTLTHSLGRIVQLIKLAQLAAEKIVLYDVSSTLSQREQAIKPDGLQRGLVGEVMLRFERKGWKLVGLKMLTAGRPLVERHYEEHVGKVRERAGCKQRAE